MTEPTLRQQIAALTPKQRIELAAKVAGYQISWSVDDQYCWLAECYDGRVNTDDPWAPDFNLHDACSLALRLRLLISVSPITVYVQKNGRTTHSSYDGEVLVQQAYTRAVMDMAVLLGMTATGPME